MVLTKEKPNLKKERKFVLCVVRKEKQKGVGSKRKGGKCCLAAKKHSRLGKGWLRGRARCPSVPCNYVTLGGGGERPYHTSGLNPIVSRGF